PMIDSHAGEGQRRLVCIGFRKAGGRPLGIVDVLCICQVKLAIAGRKVLAERSGAVADLADLRSTGGSNIPRVPSGGKDVASAQKKAADGVVGTPNRVVEAGWAAIAKEVVVDGITPAVAVIVEIRVHPLQVNV